MKMNFFKKEDDVIVGMWMSGKTRESHLLQKTMFTSHSQSSAGDVEIKSLIQSEYAWFCTHCGPGDLGKNHRNDVCAKAQ